ncbi:MAG: SPOR domain-containing protein, partial [Caldimonas sp.]
MFKQKSDPSAASARLEPADAVRLARVKARQRLIGAIVLLGIGIIGFPLVFETQPRPIPVDIPIEIPRRDALPPLAMPPPRVPPAASARATPEAASATPAGAAPRTAARASEAVITESSSDAGREIPPPRPVASNPRVAATPAAPPTAPTARKRRHRPTR